MITSRYSDTLTSETVTVTTIGSRGAKCRTAYGSEITVLWEDDLPSPVPEIGDIWIVDKVSDGRWLFSYKSTGGRYNMMRYSMMLDMHSCVGRERTVVDDIVSSGVSEVMLVVADNGIVWWDSETAKQAGLVTYNDDCLRQVVRRITDAGLSISFVMDCRLWSDIDYEPNNYYQQQVLDDGKCAYSPQWSFITAIGAVKGMVDELYGSYHEMVRGVIFRNWTFAGPFADVSDYVCGEYESATDRSLKDDMTDSQWSDEWWSKRMGIMRYYGFLQSRFLDRVKSDIGNWPVSAMVPTKQICITSERVGRFDTWIDDGFSSYGWSMVGCPLVYSHSINHDDELASFEYNVASLIRFAGGSVPLFVLDINALGDYRGIFDILSRYFATNVCLGDYADWRRLSDIEMLSMRSAMNEYSVTAVKNQDCIGILISSDSRDISFNSASDCNRFSIAAQNFATMLLSKTSHRLRIFYDGDMASKKYIKGVSSLVLFESLNMDDDAVATVNRILNVEDRNIVIIGRCGMYSGESVAKRDRIPFLDVFDESDYGTGIYTDGMTIRSGLIDISDGVYALYKPAIGILPVKHTDPEDDSVLATSHIEDDEVVAPIYSHNRNTIISIDILDDDILLDLACDFVMYAIGRDA